MKIEARTLREALEKGPQFKVHNGKVVALDETEPDMSAWPEGTTFTLVRHSGLKWMADMAFLINHWGA